MFENSICPNARGGEHIVVRCSGCGSLHSTKNIGNWNSETKVVSLSRNLFDILGCECSCRDKSQYPLVHDCEMDDGVEYSYGNSDRGNYWIVPNKAAQTSLVNHKLMVLLSNNLDGLITREDLEKIVIIKSSKE